MNDHSTCIFIFPPLGSIFFGRKTCMRVSLMRYLQSTPSTLTDYILSPASNACPRPQLRLPCGGTICVPRESSLNKFCSTYIQTKSSFSGLLLVYVIISD